MIYLDTSVALAHTMTERRRPPIAFWDADFVSSRLLQFEVWNRLHAYNAKAHRHQRTRNVLRKVGYVEMSVDVLQRALTPLPKRLTTLDGLHLATMVHLRQAGETVELASYDARLLAAAVVEGFPTMQP